MSMAAIMDGLAGLLTTADPTSNVFAWPVESVTPPATVVGYPTTWEFDSAFGSDDVGTSVFPVWFILGKSSTKASRDALSAILDGAAGIKAILDGGHAWGDVRVTGASITELSVAGVAYLAAKFDCEVYG